MVMGHRTEAHGPQLFEIIGRINDDNAVRLAELVERSIAQGRHHLVLDLSAWNTSISAGLRALVMVFKRLEQVGGQLVIASPSARVMTLFELVGLDTVLEIEDERASDAAARRASLYREVCYFA